MRFLFGILATAAALALSAAPASASYPYVFRDGHYWYGGQAYSRHQQYYGGGYEGGVYYAPGPYWYYTPVQPTYAAPPAQQYSVLPHNWKQQVLDLKKNKDDNDAYNQALRDMGVAPGAPGPTPYATPYAQQGSYTSRAASYGHGSMAGYGVRALENAYRDNTLPILAQALSQGALNSQKTGADLLTGIGQVVSDNTKNQRAGDTALKVALGYAAALQAAQPSGQVQTQTTTNLTNGQLVTQQTTTPLNPPQMPLADAVSNTTQGVLNRFCVGCHGAGGKGGVDLRNYDLLGVEAKQAVSRAVITGAMPKGGPPLPPGLQQLLQPH